MATSLENLDFNGFKRLASDFFKTLKNNDYLTRKQVEAGMKAVNIGYLETKPKTDNETSQIIIVLQMVHRKGEEYIDARNL